MRIACPTCEATYEVPDKLIGAGRRLRCAKCEHEWLVEPDSAAAPAGAPAGAPPEAPPVAPPLMDADAVPPPMVEPRRPTPAAEPAATKPVGRFAAAALWAAWIGSGLLLAALGTGAWAYRGPIVEAWPPAARVYLLFGAAYGGTARQGAGAATNGWAEAAVTLRQPGTTLASMGWERAGGPGYYLADG